MKNSKLNLLKIFFHICKMITYISKDAQLVSMPSAEAAKSGSKDMRARLKFSKDLLKNRDEDLSPTEVKKPKLLVSEEDI